MNILQTPIWENFQKALGRKVLNIQSDKCTALGIIETGRWTKRLYIPAGPNVNNSAELEAILHKALEIAKKNNLDYLRFEPSIVPDNSLIKSLNIKKSKHNVQPQWTIINDLSLTQDEILSGFSQLPRRIYRKCLKSGMEFEVSYNSDNIKYFLEFIHEVSDRTGMQAHSDEYFKTFAKSTFKSQKCGILLAKLPKLNSDGSRDNDLKEVVATILFGRTENTFYYLHAASKTSERKLSPATALAIHSLLFAKEVGCETYDFYGVTPPTDSPEYNSKKWDSWKGFTKFKESFGGIRVKSPGTYEIPIKMLKHALFMLLNK